MVQYDTFFLESSSGQCLLAHPDVSAFLASAKRKFVNFNGNYFCTLLYIIEFDCLMFMSIQENIEKSLLQQIKLVRDIKKVYKIYMCQQLSIV